MSNTDPHAPVKRRSITRMTFANPVFWLAHCAYVTGVLITPGGTWPAWWVSMLVQLGIVIGTIAIEHRYVERRAKATVLQGIADAAELRPDIFTPCPEHGDSCSVICRARARR